jgi:type 1 glutamine amidotransferase
MKHILHFLFINFLLIMPVYSQSDTSNLNVLVFSKTNGYRHEVIPTAVKMLMELGEKNNWALTCTEDAGLFNKKFLQRFDVIVFLMTINNILDGKQKKAFQHFIRSGKGFVAIHTGTITETEWPWFEQLIGTTFIGHPPMQEAELVIEDTSHPATSFFTSNKWICTDEWYSFKSNPRNKVHVLISINEDSYDVDNNEWFPGVIQRMGDHPLVWYSEYEGSRIFQTALGHAPEEYQDELFRAHLAGAINWAGRRKNINE